MARFIRQDTRQLADLAESFDTVLDYGLFHISTGDDRTALVNSLRSVRRAATTSCWASATNNPASGGHTG